MCDSVSEFSRKLLSQYSFISLPHVKRQCFPFSVSCGEASSSPQAYHRERARWSETSLEYQTQQRRTGRTGCDTFPIVSNDVPMKQLLSCDLMLYVKVFPF